MSTQSLRRFVQSIREQLVHGDIQLALDQLQAFLSASDTSLRNEIILQSARYNRLRRDVRRGVVSPGDAQTEENRLVSALLDFLDDLPERVSAELSPVDAPTVVAELALPSEIGFEVILGVNNLKQISWVERIPKLARSVCRLLTPQGLGTGFMVTSDRLMTNNHVLPTPAIAADSRAEFNYQEDSTGQLLTTYRYRLNASFFRTSHILDYTIVGVEASPDSPLLSEWGYLVLNAGADPVIGEHVVIIQHPNGGLKQVALTANQVVNIWEHRLHYTTDTMPGSSGSPIFNDQWQVVAIHHAGGKLQVNAKGEKRFTNEGILMSAIRSAAGDLWPM